MRPKKSNKQWMHSNFRCVIRFFKLPQYQRFNFRWKRNSFLFFISLNSGWFIELSRQNNHNWTWRTPRNKAFPSRKATRKLTGGIITMRTRRLERLPTHCRSFRYWKHPRKEWLPLHHQIAPVNSAEDSIPFFIKQSHSRISNRYSFSEQPQSSAWRWNHNDTLQRIASNYINPKSQSRKLQIDAYEQSFNQVQAQIDIEKLRLRTSIDRLRS